MKQMFFLEFACFFYDPMDVCNLISSSSAFSQSSLCIWKFSVHILLKPAAATAKSLQLCPTVCDPTDGSPPGSSVPGILQARTLEWVAYFLLPCMKVKSESEVVQSCPTLCDPMACSLPGSSVHGISQARVLEWGDMKL